MYSDEFGCIPVPFRVDWGSGSIEPVGDFEEAASWLTEVAHPDGFVYPPQSETVTVGVDGTTTRVPKTRRPAHLWSPPATHRITLPGAPPGEENRRQLAGFVIHFAAFLYGYRAQFTEWWVDGRLPAVSRTDLVTQALRESHLRVCFTKAVAAWTTWGERSRRVIGNAFYFYNRAPMYEWDWEQFQGEYQVLDAFYAVARAELGAPKARHHERLASLCLKFSVQSDAGVFDAIASYRNDLTHEILWGQGMPGEGFGEGFRKTMLLRNINRRIGLGLLGIESGYVRSPWRSQLSHMLALNP